uniref:tRNA (5-methylaminomethyl-2-thiouridine)(34)-methyltransferase MnmD n=1 Tax=Gelidibacter sp. TaxID=2018083 RepID=UPI004049E72A
MQRRIITTADGSTTIQIEDWNEQYHSLHGAIQEAKHVFIKHGLHHIEKNELSILEIGFGTGLNAFITLLEAENLQKHIHYVGVEAYPVSSDEITALNYIQQLQAESHAEFFQQMHTIPWEMEKAITSHFTLTKQQKLFTEITDKAAFDLIYFDAFGARVQPELWTEDIFKIMFEALKPNGILVTYAAKGSVRRAMLSVGFTVEKLQGPPGKREMLRARKSE